MEHTRSEEYCLNCDAAYKSYACMIAPLSEPELPPESIRPPKSKNPSPSKGLKMFSESPITRDELREKLIILLDMNKPKPTLEELETLFTQELDKAVEGAYKKGYIQGGHDEMQKTEQFWTKQPFPDDGATTMFIHDRFTQLKKQLKSVTTSNERGL